MKNQAVFVLTILFVVSFLPATGCDEDNGEDDKVDAGADSPEKILCGKTIEQICTKSCYCAAQASSCMYYFQSETLSTKYNNNNECTKIETELNCMGDLSGKDFNACILALQSAPCGELFSEPGLKLPSACEMIVQ